MKRWATWNAALAWLAVTAASSLTARPAVGAEPTLEAALRPLTHKGFKEKLEAIELIAGSDAENAPAILQALLDGDLFILESRGSVVRRERTANEEGVVLIDILNGDRLEVTSPGIKKIIINNKMRRSLRAALAKLRWNAPDAAVREHAAKSLMANLDRENVALLRRALEGESDSAVRHTLGTAVMLAEVDSVGPSARLRAIRGLSGSLHSEVHNRLSALIEELGDGGPEGAEALEAARSAVREIERKRALLSFVQTAYFGLSLGGVLVLAAIGLAITFGVMGVINMAHGELIMLGAYATWVVQQAMPDHIDQSLFIAIPTAFSVSATVGVAIERGVVRFLYGRPLETLLATFGVSLIVQQAVRTVFSPLNRSVATPSWMSGQWVINDALALTYNRMYIIAFAITVFLLLVGLLQRTTLGLQIRATAQNRDMARAMGIRSGRIDAITFGLGSGVAGLAGVALSQITNVGANLGQAHIVDSFMVVVFGGVGNLWGTLVAGLTLGMANKFLEPFAGAVLAKIVVLVFIVLFIQRRPKGLFPRRGRAAEA